ncbi:MAG: glycosyltransferase family 2 protein [Terriglobia bacterium]
MEATGELARQVSIIVCTVARFQELERCLHSLEPFQAGGAEVIIVNNGQHHAEVQGIADRHAARVVDELRRGLGAARNCGVRVGCRPILAFLDDDAWARPDWLLHLLQPFEDPEVLAVAGSALADSSSNPVSGLFEQFYRASCPSTRTFLQAREAACAFPLRAAMRGIGLNMAFRRAAFERFGLFDARFGRGTRIGSGEETERFLAVLLGGGKVVIEPAAVVVHGFPTDVRAYHRVIFQAGCAHTAILAKYFLQEPSLRGEVLRYAASRVLRRQAAHESRGGARVALPRLPFWLGSLYGPLAFLLSGRK